MKLVSHQVALAEELVKHPKSVIKSPPGCGQNFAICSALAHAEKPILIIDSMILLSQWARDLAHFEVEADVINPEKLRYDMEHGVNYKAYETVVWSAFNCGPKTIEAVKEVTGKARRIIITHLRKPAAVTHLSGPFKVVKLDFHGNSIYPTVHIDPKDDNLYKYLSAKGMS